MTPAKWTAKGYQLPQRWTLKKDMPAHLRREAKRVAFTFETCYVAINENGCVLMPDGTRMLTFAFHLHVVGLVIGPPDLTAADHQPWAAAWRSVVADQRLDRTEGA